MRELAARFSANARGLATARTGVAATAQTFIVNVLILAVNLGTAVLTARLLGPQGRGELAAMSMWPQLIAYLLTLGLPSALLYNLRCEPGRAEELFSAFLVLGSAMGIVATAAGVLVIPFWLTEYPTAVVRFAQAGMVVAPVALFTATFTSVLIARDEFGLYNLMRLLQPATALALLGLLAVAGRFEPRAAAAATLSAGVPWCLWMLARLWRAYRPRALSSAWALRSLLSYGVRSYGIDVLGGLATQVDRILVVGLVDPAMMGLYVVAVNIPLMLNMLPTAVVSVLFQKASGRPPGEVVAMTGRAVRVSTTASLLVAAVVAAAAPWLLDLLYGAEFRPAVPVLRILMAEAVLRGTVWVLAQAFMGLGRPGLVGALQGAGLAMNVPLMLLLLPRLGLTGAALALLISTTVRLLLILGCFPLTLGCRPPRLWPQRRDLDDLIARLRSADR